MSQPLARAVEGFPGAISAARKIAECSTLLLEVLRPWGIETLACGEVDVAARERSVFFAIEWPERWRSFYFGSGLIERDPVVEGLERYKATFTWQELRADRRISQVGTEGLDLIRAHGWSDGIVVPVSRGGTRYGIVSLVAEAPTIIPAEAKPLITLVSICYLERVRAMAPVEGFPAPPAGLSERERQCLALIARGNSDREIGAELAIAPSTAHEHFENAKRKLRARSRAESVAIAVSLGIVTV